MSVAREKDQNAELMRKMGSKTGRYDPEAPEEWRYVLVHGEPEERFLAWVKWKTTGHPTFESRSPFCVSEAGTPLKLEHAAADLGWSLKHTQNMAKEAQNHGRVRLEKGGRIWHRVDVPALPSERAEEADNSRVQGSWSPYLIDSIKNLPAEEKAKFDALEAEYLRWRDVGFAELVAEWRLMVERVENTMFAQVGIEKKRIAKTRKPKEPVVQLSFLWVPEFVQTADTNSAEFAQSAKQTSHKAQHKVSPRPASFMPLEIEEDLVAAAAFSTQAAVANELEIDERAAAALLEVCREADKTVTNAEIVELASPKLATLRATRGVRRPVALLLEDMPGMCRGKPLADLRRSRAATVERNKRAEAEAAEAMREMLAQLDDPQVSEKEKTEIRQILGIKSKTAGGGS